MEPFNVFPDDVPAEERFASIRWSNEKRRSYFLQHVLSLGCTFVCRIAAKTAGNLLRENQHGNASQQARVLGLGICFPKTSLGRDR